MLFSVPRRVCCNVRICPLGKLTEMYCHRNNEDIILLSSSKCRCSKVYRIHDTLGHSKVSICNRR
jgi:hypothetical protein